MAARMFCIVACLVSSADAGARVPSPYLVLRGGDNAGKDKALLVAQQPSKRFLSLPPIDKLVDTVMAGVGLAGTFAVMGALEAKFSGVKLFVPPMMASGIIFFSPATPPSPKGFVSGTIGCSSLSAAVLSLFNGMSSVSPVAAQGAAAGALLMWYKATNSIFPPAAVLCVLMSGQASSLSFVARTWLGGHACLYSGAMAVSAMRQQVRMSIARSSLRSLGGLSKEDLLATFRQFDLSKDGSLDASELKCALKVALGTDLSLKDCQNLIAGVDKDGNGEVDFGEFMAICKAKEQ